MKTLGPSFLNYVGWLLTLSGTMLFIGLFCMFFSVFEKRNYLVEDSYYYFQILNVLCIGVGAYLIKNFTPEKKSP
jgi:hypothetical protein